MDTGSRRRADASQVLPRIRRLLLPSKCCTSTACRPRGRPHGGPPRRTSVPHTRLGKISGRPTTVWLPMDPLRLYTCLA